MKKKKIHHPISRDISWLSFNARVLQEAGDHKLSFHERLRFLGIFSNNLDEFFRVRVATLYRMIRLGKKAKMYLETNPERILKQIQATVLEQQKRFDEIYAGILQEMKNNGVEIRTEESLDAKQKEFVTAYFNENVRTNISPLMIESIPQLPLLHDRSIYLACVLTNTHNSFMNSYALIEVPVQVLPRFIILPSPRGQHHLILLEDIIRFSLPLLFSQFGFNSFESYIIKMTRDAELDLDNDIQSGIIDSIEKGLKNRKKGRAVRLVYDRSIPRNLLDYLVKLLNLSHKDHLIAGGRIHNFKDFMSFPSRVFEQARAIREPFVHPLLKQPVRILEVLNQRDVMLHFPYHSFDSVIDLLREAAIDPYVDSIKITCYRLASNSRIIGALINAKRNGKKVTVVMELRARFDEEANLTWKRVLEEEGIRVLTGLPNMKVHAKLCLISKKVGKQMKHYGFCSTGNLNENTAEVYGDHCLLTSDKKIVNDIRLGFRYFETPANTDLLKNSKLLVWSPVNTRNFFIARIKDHVKKFKSKKQGRAIIKLNSITDVKLMDELYNAAHAGMDIQLLIRGISTMQTEGRKGNKIHAISIIDQYLEHARVFYFSTGNAEEIYISSADWMIRNLDHRIEVTTPVLDAGIREELKEILNLQLAENVKARVLNDTQDNKFVPVKRGSKKVRSQLEIYNYLLQKKYT